MTDDIVTRLRKHHEWFGTGGQPTSVWEDAADEIELLRKESYVWEIVTRRLAKELGKEEYADAAYQDEYDILEDARI